MEIINDKKEEGASTAKTSAEAIVNNKSTALWGGAALFVCGALWLCYNYNLLPDNFFTFLFSWQTLVIICGLWLLAIKQYAWGAIVSLVGVVFLLIDIFGIYISFTKLVLPILLMASGVAIVVAAATQKGK